MVTLDEIKNAKITSTMLGIEGHGVFTCQITLDYGGSGQSFGGYCFDTWSEKDQRRIGAAFGIDFLMHLLRVVGVEKWEDLKGKHVRVRASHSKVYAIGHIIEDKWFAPDELEVRV